MRKKIKPEKGESDNKKRGQEREKKEHGERGAEGEDREHTFTDCDTNKVERVNRFKPPCCLIGPLSYYQPINLTTLPNGLPPAELSVSYTSKSVFKKN